MSASRVNIPRKVTLDELAAKEINEIGEALNAHAADIDGLAFVPIAANQYGNHPAFGVGQRHEMDVWVLSRLAGLVSTTPDAPNVSFDPATRVLAASSPLGSAQIEYKRGTGEYQAYQAIQVDNLRHEAGEWVFRIKPQAGQAASTPTNSPEIGVKAAGVAAPVVVYTSSNRRLSASHSLGGTLLYSYRGSDFLEYLGAIQVDDVSHDAGEWRFKRAASTGYAESAVATNPAIAPAVVIVAPTINNLSPTSAAVDASVTISGTNFGATAGTAGTVKFNGILANVLTWSDTAITAKVPTGGATGNVVVTTAAGQSNGVAFTIKSSSSALWATTGKPFKLCFDGMSIMRGINADLAGRIATRLRARLAARNDPRAVHYDLSDGTLTNVAIDGQNEQQMIDNFSDMAATFDAAYDCIACSAERYNYGRGFTNTRTAQDLYTKFVEYDALVQQSPFIGHAAYTTFPDKIYGSYLATAGDTNDPATSVYRTRWDFPELRQGVAALMENGYAGGAKFIPINISGTIYDAANPAKAHEGVHPLQDGVDNDYLAEAAVDSIICGIFGTARPTPPNRATKPFISNFYPNGGSPGTALFVQGSNFDTATSFKIGGIDCTVSTKTYDKCVLTIPAGITVASPQLVITNPLGSATANRAVVVAGTGTGGGNTGGGTAPLYTGLLLLENAPNLVQANNYITPKAGITGDWGNTGREETYYGAANTDFGFGMTYQGADNTDAIVNATTNPLGTGSYSSGNIGFYFANGLLILLNGGSTSAGVANLISGNRYRIRRRGKAFVMQMGGSSGSWADLQNGNGETITFNFESDGAMYLYLDETSRGKAFELTGYELTAL